MARPRTAEIRSWPSADGSIDTVVVVTTDRAAMALEVEGAAAAVVRATDGRDKELAEYRGQHRHSSGSHH